MRQFMVTAEYGCMGAFLAEALILGMAWNDGDVIGMILVGLTAAATICSGLLFRRAAADIASDIRERTPAPAANFRPAPTVRHRTKPVTAETI